MKKLYIYQHETTLEKRTVDLFNDSREEIEALEKAGFKRLMRKNMHDFIERETSAALSASPESYKTEEELEKLSLLVLEKWKQKRAVSLTAVINALADTFDDGESE